MNLSDFIFNGKIEDFAIGNDIKESKIKLDLTTDADGDIPALYELNYKNIFFQISALNNIIIGISCDFGYNPKAIFKIIYQTNSFNLGYSTSYYDFLSFLKLTDLEYELREGCEIYLLRTGVSFIFINSESKCLVKTYIFDSTLYEKLIK